MDTRTPLEGVTFRWSITTIRRKALRSGVILTLLLSAYVLWDATYGSPVPVTGRLNLALVGLALAATGGILTAILLAGIFLVGRAGSKTVVSSEGLYVQRALWRKDFVRWSDIQSVKRRNLSGWRYIYMRTSTTLSEVAMSVEIDNPSDFDAEVSRWAPSDNPLRVALSSHGT